MKPIIKQEQQDTILTSEITVNHIVVCADTKYAYLLTHDYEGKKKVYFRNLKNALTSAPCYPAEFVTIDEAVKHMMGFDDVKVEVFKQSDWKLALQWLIDNA